MCIRDRDAAVGFLFWRARNKSKRKLLSALDNRRWNKTQTKLEIDNLQSQKEYWIYQLNIWGRLFYRTPASLWTTPIISLHLGTIALWSFTSTTLYAIRFLRSDENIIFPAVMPSVRMLIPQDKRVIWHMIAKRHSSWLLILKSAEQSKKEIAGCVFCEATKISFFRLWCQACGYWSRRISVFYDTWLQKDATVGFLFRRARNKAKSKLLSALDNRRWNKTQTKLEIDNLQSQKEYWI